LCSLAYRTTSLTPTPKLPSDLASLGGFRRHPITGAAHAAELIHAEGPASLCGPKPTIRLRRSNPPADGEASGSVPQLNDDTRPRRPGRRSPFTAFTFKPRSQQITGRLIVRRVRDANPSHLVPDEQGELFPAWRHHAVFTDSPLPMVDAEADHRRHAVIEQVIADLKAGALAHLPSAWFTANGAWLVLAAIAFNLTRAAGALASTFHARATTATIRAQLITIPARPTRSARRVTLRLPSNWPWQHAWLQFFTTATGPPALAAA
jgi:hypothetical protein